MKEVAPLQYGVVFKKAFSNPSVFKGFVRDILQIELEIDHVETEKSFERPIGKVNTRFDLFAEDKKNRVIVDIQHVRYPDHYDRFLYYHCVAMLEQISSYEFYTPRLRVFTIVVSTSGDRQRTDVATIEFDPKDLQGKPLNEMHHRIVYLCPKYLNETTPEPYREWMAAINDSLDKTVDETAYHVPEVRQMLDMITVDSISPEEGARIIDENNIELLKQEWRKEKALEIATAMKSSGITLDQIVQLTGLTLEELIKL